jgi:predicted dehydrogenase
MSTRPAPSLRPPAATGRNAGRNPPGHPSGAESTKPDKAPGPRTEPPAPSPAVGKPVSQTAAAHDDDPTVPAPNQDRVRFALVGLGKLVTGEVLPALRLSTKCEITALVTGHRDKGNAFADFLDLPRRRVFGYEDIPTFRDDPSIEAVYIATPNALHARDAIAALNAGKHVLCEKPMATTLADTDAMITAAKAAGRKLMIAYRVHHEPLNNTLRGMLKDKKYGKPHFVSFDACIDVGAAPQYRLDRELNGGGSLFDIGIYALNTTCWLLGEAPVEVSAMERTPRDDRRFKEIEQSIAFQMRFPSGCIAACTSSFSTARANRYRVICEKGWLAMDPATHYRGLHAEHADDAHCTRLTQPESVNQFAAEFEHFAACIREDKPPESPGEEGRRDVDLMHRIYEAARTGRTIRVA